MLCSCKSYIRINVSRAPRGGTSSQSDTRLLTKPCAVGVEISSSMHAQADHLHTDATRKAVAVDQPACTIFIHVADSLWRRRSAVSCLRISPAAAVHVLAYPVVYVLCNVLYV
ncbi:hypothetical protein PsYK624_128590 [Phanerochaete sordida]|uniref:Uncharacterized protein n=1 Tax=Phanerochaete sordida TaxID=48140 RepID=A0A9P3LIY5_9APHY|nr:hypothetical protein PsYK624_128590 [Phanerochaete sordida]